MLCVLLGTMDPYVVAAGTDHRKRVRRADFPGMDDTAYHSMMQRRRKEQETLRDRGRDRTGRAYPEREHQKLRNRAYLAASDKRQALLFAASPQTYQRSAWSEAVPDLALDQPISADGWWQRLQKHGFVAGNMLNHTVEAHRLHCHT